VIEIDLKKKIRLLSSFNVYIYINSLYLAMHGQIEEQQIVIKIFLNVQVTYTVNIEYKVIKRIL
jgi:hypothetical protein